MAFQQNGIPGTLRPLNIVRPVATTFEDAHTTPVTTNGRNMDEMVPNSGYVNVCGTGTHPVYYTYKVADAGYPLPSPYWGVQVPADAGGSPVIGVDSRSGLVGNMVSGNASDQTSEDGGDDSSSGKKVKFMCSIGGKIVPRPCDGILRYVGGETRIISVRKDINFEQLMLKMANTYGQLVALKYQLPDEDLDALVSVSCSDDVENMMEEYEKLCERSADGTAKLRMFLFPTSEQELLGMRQYEDLSGGKYVDAVNGILDDAGGSITRKESVASADSPYAYGVEAAESQGDGSELPSTGILSPAESITASQEHTPRLAFSDAVHTNYSDSTSIPFGVPVISSVVTQPFNVLPDSQFGSYLKQQGYQTAQPSQRQPYYPPLMNYSHQQPVQSVLPAYQPQLQTDNMVAVNMHQILPPPQIATASPLMANMTHPFMQCPPTVMDNYSTFSPRVVQAPLDRNYAHHLNASQIPHSGIGGAYGWNHVQQNQPILLGAPTPHHPVIVPDTIPKRQACYMCQKALPHAHSDMLVQDNSDALTSPASDVNSNHSGFGVGENLGGALLKTMPLDSKASREVQALVGVPQSHGAYTYEPMIPSKTEHLGNSRMMLPQCSVGFDGRSPYGMILDNTVQPIQHMVPNHCESRLMFNEVPIAGCIPFQAAQQQHVVYTTKPFCNPPEVVGIMPNEVTVDIAGYNPRPIDELMDKLSVGHENMNGTRDVSTRPRYEELLEHKPIEETQIFGFHRNVPTGASGIQAHVQAEVPRANHPPVEPHTAVKQAYGGIPGQYAQPDGVPHQTSPTTVGHTIPPAGDGVVQESSNSLFSNQDPWNMWQEVHFRPRVPTRFAASNEQSGVKEEKEHSEEHFVENYPRTNRQAEPTLDNTIKKVIEPTPNKGEPAAQETGGFCIDIATKASPLAAACDPGLKPDSETNPMRGGQTRDLGLQRSPKFQDARGKLLDPGNLGFPESDGLGRLQIISNNDLEELQELGSGTFGTVYHGKWRGTDVAIKRINNRCFVGKPSEQDRMRKDFWNEAIKLADLHHPNVVAFYGVVLDGPGGSMATVTEYMVNGSLRNALQKNERSLDKHKRLLILMDAAFGMEYLHGKNIVHFDLKSDNLLVNLRDPRRPVCKVGDLGLSKVKCKTLISGGVRGTLPWMAPELLNGSSSLVSEKVDVYSFGIVMWELLTGEEPYADLHYGTIIGGIVSNTLRPTVPDSCDPEWRSMMERCWSAEPSERPNFTEAANQLRAMAAKSQK